MEHGASLLRDGVVLLGFGLIFVLIFRRFGLGATLGYLVAGAVVGPQLLGLVGGAESKMGIAELGITLLLFIVGLELNPSRLWRMKQEIFGLGTLQVVLCGLAISAVVWVGTRSSVAATLALGLPLALSSTAQVLPMLQSAGRMRTPFGERAFSILLFQDLSIVPLITIIAVMSRNPADADGPPGWLLFIYTLIAIAGLILAGRFLLRPLFRTIGNMGEREMFVFAGLFTVIASAAVMESLGLSTALGAFVAGVMLADSPYRHELEADVEPFRSILLGLFFLTIGMLLDLHAIAERPLFVAGMALALIATKAAIIMGIGLLFKMRWREALALGLLLSQGRIRLRPVCSGAECAVDRARGGEPVRGHRHAVDGDDTIPDAGDSTHPDRAGQAGGSRGADLGRCQCTDRWLRAVRPDRRPDAGCAGHSGDPDRQ